MAEKAESTEEGSKQKSKTELEREKLLLEIKELKQKWWKKTTYVAALFPTILTLITLIYGFANGYFQASFLRLQAETTKLENQKYELQKEINEFTRQKNEIEINVRKMSNELKDTKMTADLRSTVITECLGEKEKLATENKFLKAEIEGLKTP